jgi:hypothetical protein
MLSAAILLGALGLSAVAPAGAEAEWRVDVGVTVLREAWDFNGATETLGGVVGGTDRRVWRGVAVRGELVALRVWQRSGDAWLRGFTLGTRMRWGGGAVRPLLDVAVGMSNATGEVPAGGTRFNYLAVIGGGVERAVGATRVVVTGRWLHASNNGREGRHLNPDIQSLGVLVGVGWEH